MFPFGIIAAILAAVPAAGQFAVGAVWHGPYDYVVTGASLRTGNNGGATACTVGASASATVSGIPAGATVVGAYLYWAGSGPADNTVTFAGSGISASRTWTGSYVQSPNVFQFFGAFADVTSRVSGNGSFTLSGLTVANGAPYCASEAVLAGWTLYVVYQAAALPPRQIRIAEGFQVLREQTYTVPISGFVAAGGASSVEFTTHLWEGDPDITGDERVRLNTTTLSSGTNVFDSSVGGATGFRGLDLDRYTSSLPAGTTSANVEVRTGLDLVILHTIATSIRVQPAYGIQATPDGTVVQRLPGGGYPLTFTITNTSNTNIVAGLVVSGSGTPFFVTPTGLGGPGVTGTARPDSFNVAIPFGGTATFTVTYTVPPGENATNFGLLRARVGAQPSTFDDASSGVERVSPQLTLQKNVTPTGVVVRGTELTYEMAFANEGEFAAVAVAVIDEVPPQVAFKLGSATQTLPGGLSATVAYSNNAGATWAYTPVSGGCGAAAGFDGCVQRVRWTLSGPLPSGGGAPSSGTVRFVAVIR